MELAESDLRSIINEIESKSELDMKKFLSIFKDSILGMTCMHMNSMAHRDIKPENIM